MSGPRPDDAAGAGGPREAEDDGRPARSWRWGQLSGGQGLGIVVIAAALGALVSVATKHEPGPLLGGFVVAGSLIAVLAVRPRSAYLMIPVPALCYLVSALAAGLARNHSASSSSALTVNAAQWIANGFLTMAAATVVAIVITAGRWFWARRARGAQAGPRPQAVPAGRGAPPLATPEGLVRLVGLVRLEGAMRLKGAVRLMGRGMPGRTRGRGRPPRAGASRGGPMNAGTVIWVTGTSPVTSVAGVTRVMRAGGTTGSGGRRGRRRSARPAI